MKTQEEFVLKNRFHTNEYLRKIGVSHLPPLSSPFDPGYDPLTLESHLEQSSHLMLILKISMSCWLVADEQSTRRKVAAAKRYNVPTVTGSGPFEIAVAQHQLPEYLDLCADIGFTRIECGQGFTTITMKSQEVVQLANERDLEVQFELGNKHQGSFSEQVVDKLIETGQRWIDAGATHVVVEARESANGVGLFDRKGDLNKTFADRFADSFGLHSVVFEAPTKQSQFALLDHFGQEVCLGNVRLEELLRAEIYRRGLHADAFLKDRLRPRRSRALTQEVFAGVEVSHE